MIDMHKPLDLVGVYHEAPDFIRTFLENLQGNILKSHGRPYITLLLLHFKEGAEYLSSARASIEDFAKKYVTSAWKQFDDAFDRLNTPNYEERLFCMLLISADGYRYLSGYDTHNYEFPTNVPADIGFQLGMKNSLGWTNLTKTWDDNYGIHAMLLLAHQDQVELQKYQVQFTKALEPFCIVTYEQGARVTLKENSVEHFGFADGISNPLFIREEIEQYRKKVGVDLHWDPATSLDQVLVEEPQFGDNPKTYGSYMVFYKLEQNLDAFKKGYDDKTSPKVFGRNPNGTPLIKSEGDSLNNFNYESDPNGRVVEREAHIRRMNARLEQSPRIARRGITYDYGQEGRGILFMSFQADIQKQFETLLDEEQGDALLNSNAGLVKAITGQYFHAPSLPALRSFATLDEGLQRRFHRAFMALLKDDRKLTEFGETWKKDRTQAIKSVGITPNDLATLYAFFRVGDREVMEGIRQGRATIDQINSQDSTPATPFLNNTVNLGRAMKQLLEPETLGKFISLWPTEPQQALELVGLEPKDAEDFYKHLAEKGVILDWPVWL